MVSFQLDFTPYNAGPTFNSLWERSIVIFSFGFCFFIKIGRNEPSRLHPFCTILVTPIFKDKGLDTKRGGHLGDQLRAAGLEGVETVQRSISLAPQTGVLGKLHLDDLEDLLTSLKVRSSFFFFFSCDASHWKKY